MQKNISFLAWPKFFFALQKSVESWTENFFLAVTVAENGIAIVRDNV